MSKKDPTISFSVDLSDEEDPDILEYFTGSREPISSDENAQVEFEAELPAKYEVCDRCRGKGTHVNPNIDGNGLTAEDFAEDPDFKEDYFSGVYDVTCQECEGLRVVPVLDEENIPPKILKMYREDQEQQAEWDAEDRYWRRLESGGEY